MTSAGSPRDGQRTFLWTRGYLLASPGVYLSITYMVAYLQLFEKLSHLYVCAFVEKQTDLMR